MLTVPKQDLARLASIVSEYTRPNADLPVELLPINKGEGENPPVGRSLYLGSMHEAQSVPILEAFNITHIFSCIHDSAGDIALDVWRASQRGKDLVSCDDGETVVVPLSRSTESSLTAQIAEQRRAEVDKEALLRQQLDREQVQSGEAFLQTIRTIYRGVTGTTAGGIEYDGVCALDDDGYDILGRDYERFKRFADTALSCGADTSGGSCLLHCAAGMNRSGCLAVAYLMERQGWSLERAFRHCAERRGMLLQNEGFQTQLVEFAKTKGFVLFESE